jgi:hypothetical protein
MPTKHSAVPWALARLRDAFMVPCEDDVARVKQDLVKRGMTPAEADRLYVSHFAYFVRRIRRVVPAPPVLLQRLELVREAFQQCSTDDDGDLWSGSLPREWDNMLEHVRRGCLRYGTAVHLTTQPYHGAVLAQ